MRTRTRLLFVLTVTALTLSAPFMHGQQSCTLNAIACENQLPGTLPAEWDISGAGDASLQGFATEISVTKGETIHFKVDTTAPTFTLAIYRIGYYGGRGARLIASQSSLPGIDQPACLTQAATGLIDCGNWIESASWTVPATAVSGVYVAKLTRSGSSGSHILFIVRDDAAQADLVLQTSDTTWQAYNTFGGNSLYVGGPGTNPGRAYKVSYNRPITTRGTSPEDHFFNAEYPMVRWLEANGYSVSYISGADTDRYGATELLRHRVFLAVGHDEYWSGAQRHNVEAARDAGVHLAFLTGNGMFWKTRWEPSIDGTASPYRTLVSYKETHANAKIDPQDPPTWTGTWRDPRFSPPADGGRPENALMGTIFTVNWGGSGSETWPITVPQTFATQPFWRNTRIATLPPGGTATLAAGTIGYEWDENLNNGSRPAGLITLSATTRSVAQKILDYGSTYGAGTATHALTLYRALSGALVFGAGTVQWSWGLDGNHDRNASAPDLAMQQATVNLLSDMGVEPATLQAGLVPGLLLPDFTIVASPASRVVAPGGSTTFTTSITATNGFADSVDMTVTGLPPGTTASFSPSPIVGSGDTILTVSTSAGTPTGTSTLTVTGTSGGRTHSTTATLFVSTAQPGPGVISIDFVGSGVAMGAAESAGVVAKTNWNSGTGASRATPLALKDETGAATTATATWAANSLWMMPITDQAGNRRLMKGYLDSANTSTTTVTVAGLPAAAYDIYVYADGDNGSAQRTGAYSISGAGITTTTVNLIDLASTNFNTAFTQGTNSAGNYVKFSITAAGFTISATPVQSADVYLRAPLNGIQIVPTAPPAPDFTVATSPGSRTVTPGGSTSYTVTIGALNGFSGQVSFGATGLPANTTAVFTPSTLTGAGTATLDITTAGGTPTGSSTLTVTGTSGALNHTSTATLIVSPPPDFTIAASPASRSVNPGGTASYTVTIGALNGFSGPVSFGATGLPANTSATFTPPTVTGAGMTTLSVTTAANTPVGTSTLTITGTSGALNHAAMSDIVVTNAPVGGVIGLDFVGSAPVAMGAAESAGVVAKTNWNSGTGASRATPLALKDETGAATTATAMWAANSLWMMPITDQAGNRRLMKGYLDSANTSTTTVTVAGLPNGAYDIYVYADGDNGSAQRTAAYTISGAGITTTTVNLIDLASTNFNTAFTQGTNSAGNYVKFSITAAGFTVSTTPVQSADVYRRAPLNGIQIVPTAPPAP